jgi:hypothetical protein
MSGRRRTMSRTESVNPDDFSYFEVKSSVPIYGICFADDGTLSVGDRFDITRDGKRFVGTVTETAGGVVYGECDAPVAMGIKVSRKEVKFDERSNFRSVLTRKENKDGEQADT